MPRAGQQDIGGQGAFDPNAAIRQQSCGSAEVGCSESSHADGPGRLLSTAFSTRRQGQSGDRNYTQDRHPVLQHLATWDNLRIPAASYYEDRYRARVLANLRRRAKSLGYMLNEMPAPAQFLRKLVEAVTEETQEHPGQPVEVWATDEHRLGLKPVRRRVWRPSASGLWRSAIIAMNGSMSPPSSSRQAGRRSGICRTASASRSSKSCWPTSPRPSAQANSAASFSSSTMPGGMARRASRFPRACAWSFFRPTPQNCSPPNAYRRSSANRSPIHASKRSPTSTPSSPIDAGNSATINRRSPRRQTSSGRPVAKTQPIEVITHESSMSSFRPCLSGQVVLAYRGRRTRRAQRDPASRTSAAPFCECPAF